MLTKAIGKNKMLMKLLPYIFILIAALIIGSAFASGSQRTKHNIDVSLTNQTYTRATNCFAATTPTKRTPEYVKECYLKAEAATGKQIEWYGDATR